jgi:hypothetical protein
MCGSGRYAAVVDFSWAARGTTHAIRKVTSWAAQHPIPVD